VTDGDVQQQIERLNQEIGPLYQQGRYEQAISIAIQARELIRRHLGENNAAYADSLNSSGMLYREVGDYAKAKSCFEQALGVYDAVVGEGHPVLANTMNNLGELYHEIGDYAEAELRYQKALEIYSTALGKQHPFVATTLNNLAALYFDMGDYEAAELRDRQALEIRRTALGEKHPEVAQSLTHLAALSWRRGDYDEAKSAFQQALSIRRETLGENHPEVIQSLNNLATLYVDTGNYAEAKRLYEESLQIARKTLGQQHHDMATCLNNLSSLYHTTGDYSAAMHYLEQALEIKTTTLGEQHPDTALSLSNMAKLCVATGNVSKAFSLIEQAANIHGRLVGRVFAIGSEKQRIAYLTTLRDTFDTFLSLVLEHLAHSVAARQAALELVLRRKGVGVEASSTQFEAVLSGRYPHLQPKLGELVVLSTKINRKILDGPGSEGSDAHRLLLADWNAERERLEKELVRKIPEMDLAQRLAAVDFRMLAGVLPEESVLIELVRFTPFGFDTVPARWEATRYLAFVVLSGMPDSVQMFDLGDAETLDRSIGSFRASITGDSERGEERVVDKRSRSAAPQLTGVSVRADRSRLRSAIEATRHARPRLASEERLDNTSLGLAIRRALFDPLVAFLDGRKRLFVAPDGDLARLPFEVLPTDNGTCLIDEYQISYVGVGRDALRFESAPGVEPGPPLVAADPDFDLDLSNGRAYGAKEVPFERLEGTRVEGERIAELLDVEPLLGSGALEKSVKDSRSPRVLHLATHGFFLADTPRDLNEEQIGLGPVDGPRIGSLARLTHVENPLLRSGLALAGANTWLEGNNLPEEAEDGLLTAEDVTGMDLLATELVVLSACETGLGEVHGGEGVYGLRRAFVVAGANTLVMSLWQVPDKQTQELMEDFYMRILERQSLAEALREAQLAIKEKYPDPLYWGAFVCQGDPDPLTLARSGHD